MLENKHKLMKKTSFAPVRTSSVTEVAREYGNHHSFRGLLSLKILEVSHRLRAKASLLLSLPHLEYAKIYK